MTARYLVDRVHAGGAVLFVVRAADLRPGPANGGLRLLDYDSDHRALADALRLARRMTLKHTLYATGFSGAKLVARADPATVDRQALLRAVANVLDRHLYTGCDMNTTDSDMRVLSEFSPYVLAAVHSAVDASLATAHGVVAATRQAIPGPVPGTTFLVHGVGKTGAAVATLLAAEGGHVTTYDHDPAARPVPGCTPLPTSSPWWEHPADVLVLCSASGVVDEHIADRLRCRTVVSGANCPFTSRAAELHLTARGVLSVPDVVANAGAVVCDSIEHHRPEEFRTCPPDAVYRFVAETVADRTAALLRLARGDGRRVDEALRRLLDRPPAVVCGTRFAPALSGTAGSPPVGTALAARW